MSDNLSVVQLMSDLGARPSRCEMELVFPYGTIEHYKLDELLKRNVTLYATVKSEEFLLISAVKLPAGLTPGKRYAITNLSVEGNHDQLRVEIEDDSGLAYRTDLFRPDTPLMLDLAAAQAAYESTDRNDLLEEAKLLDKRWNTYTSDDAPSFEDGDFVRWRQGLAAGGLPVKAIGRIVTDSEFVLQVYKINQQRKGIEPFDCVVVYVDQDGDLAFAPSFTRRLEKVGASDLA